MIERKSLLFSAKSTKHYSNVLGIVMHEVIQQLGFVECRLMLKSIRENVVNDQDHINYQLIFFFARSSNFAFPNLLFLRNFS